MSLYFLSGKADGKQASETFPKRKVYLFLRNVQLFWLLYTLAAIFCHLFIIPVFYLINADSLFVFHNQLFLRTRRE